MKVQGKKKNQKPSPSPPPPAPPPPNITSGINVANSPIFSLILSLLLLSTALCDSLLRLRFSFARRACFSEGVRVDAEDGVVVDVDVVEEATEN